MNAPERLTDRPYTRANPFDAMHSIGALAPDDIAVNFRRWKAGDQLRRVHAKAYARHFDIDVALDAQTILEQIEAAVGASAWPIIVRIVIEGATIQDCQREPAGRLSEDAILDRLRAGLDRVGELLGVIAET